MMWIAGWLWSQCKENWPNLNLILGTPIHFAILGWHQCSSRLLTVLLGTLWISIKQLQVPYVFDWQNAIPLDTMQGNRSSSRGEGIGLMGFLALRQKPGVYSRVTAGMYIRNWSLFSEASTPIYVWGTTQECKLDMAGQYGHFWKLSGSSGLFFYLTQWYWDS